MIFSLLISSFTESINFLNVQEFLDLSMSGSMGERSLTDIITSIRYWIIHTSTIPSLFIAGWLFDGTCLAYDVFGLILLTYGIKLTQVRVKKSRKRLWRRVR